jgi:hypothetical protein
MRTMILMLVAVVAGCGGGGGSTSSGVDPAKLVVDLTTDEYSAFCEWSIELQGGAGHVESCGDGFDITIFSVAECVANLEAATCTATVGEMETCINALDGNACRILTEPSCEVLLACGA